MHLPLFGLWGLCVGLCFGMHYFVSFLVLHSSESWLLCFYCLFGVLLLLMFCNSSSRCIGLVCSVCLSYLLTLNAELFTRIGLIRIVDLFCYSL